MCGCILIRASSHFFQSCLLSNPRYKYCFSWGWQNCQEGNKVPYIFVGEAEFKFISIVLNLKKKPTKQQKTTFQGLLMWKYHALARGSIDDNMLGSSLVFFFPSLRPHSPSFARQNRWRGWAVDLISPVLLLVKSANRIHLDKVKDCAFNVELSE